MSETHDPQDSPLTFEQAIDRLAPPEAEAQEVAAEAGAEIENSEGGDQPPEDAGATQDNAGEGEEAEAEIEAVAPVDPPRYWSTDAKAAFSQLPPDLQAVVLEQEGPREAAAAKVKAEAAQAISAAAAETAKVTQLAEQLAGFLPQALETFRSRWGDAPDWAAMARESGAEAMIVAKAEYEAEQDQLHKLVAATQQAEAQARDAYVRTEFQRLAEIAPDLADPEKGPERRIAVGAYLKANGITEEAISQISATEMLIAEKARLYDELKANAAAKPSPKPNPLAARPALVRPAASASHSPTRSAIQQAQSRFNLNPSIENAEALLQAKG